MEGAKVEIVLDGLEVARRVADAVGEVLPTMFVVKMIGKPDWDHGVPLSSPAEYVTMAELLHAPAVIVIGSHTLIDADHPTVKVIRLYAGIINADGEVAAAAKMLRWSDQRKWTEPSISTRVPIAAVGWRF